MGTSGTDVAPPPLRIVLLDSREERRRLMIDVVEGDGDRAFVVAEADSRQAARVAVRETEADAVVVDLRMPTAEGLRAVRDLRGEFPSLGIVVCSFDVSDATRRQALLDGADACLPKPASPHEVVEALCTAHTRLSAAYGGAPALAAAG